MVVFLLLICAGFAVWTLRDLGRGRRVQGAMGGRGALVLIRVVPARVIHVRAVDVFSVDSTTRTSGEGRALAESGDAIPLSEEGIRGTRGVVLHFTRAAFGDAYAFQHPAARGSTRACCPGNCWTSGATRLCSTSSQRRPPGRDSNVVSAVAAASGRTLTRPLIKTVSVGSHAAAPEAPAYSAPAPYLQVPLH